MIPRTANILNSHVPYKLKRNDEKSLALKAIIAPDVNEDRDKDTLKTDCQTRLPVGTRRFISLAALMEWIFKRVDAKVVF